MPTRFCPKTGKKRFELHNAEHKTADKCVSILLAMADCKIDGTTALANDLTKVLKCFDDKGEYVKPEPAKT